MISGISGMEMLVEGDHVVLWWVLLRITLGGWRLKRLGGKLMASEVVINSLWALDWDD